MKFKIRKKSCNFEVISFESMLLLIMTICENRWNIKPNLNLKCRVLCIVS